MCVNYQIKYCIVQRIITLYMKHCVSCFSHFSRYSFRNWCLLCCTRIK